MTCLVIAQFIITEPIDTLQRYRYKSDHKMHMPPQCKTLNISSLFYKCFFLVNNNKQYGMRSLTNKNVILMKVTYKKMT